MNINLIRVFDEGPLVAPLMKYPSFAAFWAAWRHKLPSLYWHIDESVHHPSAGHTKLPDGKQVRVIALPTMPTSEFDALRCAHEMLHFVFWKMGYPAIYSIARRVPKIAALCETLGSLLVDGMINKELARFFDVNALTLSHDKDTEAQQRQRSSVDHVLGFDRIANIIWLAYVSLRWRATAGDNPLPSIEVYRAKNPTIAAETDALLAELTANYPLNPSAHHETLMRLIERYDLQKLNITPATLEGSAGWDDIAPTAAQRQAIGAALGMFQDAWNYKALLLYGEQGGLMTGAKDANPVQWTAINTSDNSTGSVVADETLTVSRTTGATVSTSFNTIVGVSYTITISGSGQWHPSGLQSDAFYADNMGSEPWNRVNVGASCDSDGIIQLTVDGDIFPSIPAYASSHIYSVTMSGTGSPFSFKYCDTIYGDNTGSHSVRVQGSAPISSTQTNVGNLTFSINRRGWAGWLVDDGTSMKFTSTKNYFQSNVAVTLCGTADSTQSYVQNVTTGSYNNPDGTGVIFAAAGSAIMRSLDWGATWSTLHYLSPNGGLCNVGYATTGGAANSGTSPEYTYVVGNMGGGSVGFRRANGSTAIVNTAGNVPLTAQCLVSFTTNSSYYFLGCGTALYYSDDAGATWTARYPGGTIYGVGCSPQNHLFALVYGPSLLKYTVDGGANFTDLHTSWRGFADVQYGAGTALNIVTSCADLSLLYQNEVTHS